MADKFLELQQQMRNNQEDLKQYLRDLDNWESNIKKKDKELRTGSSSKQEKDLPPVRNQVKEKLKRKKKKPESNNQETKEKLATRKPRIKAYDYRKWDTFDVDKACAEVDSGNEGNKTSSEYETDSDEERKQNTRQQKIMQANMEKEKGNDFFKAGKYDEAMLCYTRGMEADNTNAILPANRAMALLKLKRFEEAESDCNLSLSLDCTYVKAVARRASARVGLGKYSEAKKDFEQVLVLEPSNKLAASEIKRINKLQDEKEKESLPTNVIQAVNKPPHLRSKKPLKRIRIEEIGTVPVESESPSLETQSEQQATTNKSVDATVVEDSQKITETSQQIDASENITEKVVSENETAVPVIGPAPSVPPVPQSSYHLLTDWRSLENHPVQLKEYFKQIDPITYPSLFKQSMESDVLLKILNLLHDHYIPSNEPMFDVVTNLTKIKRFDMNVMFMSSQEKKLVRSILDHISKNEDISEDLLKDISKKYGL